MSFMAEKILYELICLLWHKTKNMQTPHLPTFIGTHITKRKESLFHADIQAFSAALQAEIADKSVLVIGGAGTIGSSFIKALLPFRPARLWVVDINENALTELVRDLRSTADMYIPTDFKSYPVNFGESVFEKILAAAGNFDIVAHFAAHKHVRSEKDIFAIEAMLENNVFRTYRLLEMLTKSPPKHFFCVSTDKAANPVNVMGASKKLMEETVMAFAPLFPVTTARFANVAFSNGSLLAGFVERMAKRQPLAAPSDIKRYFVSPTESGQLCLIACVLGKTGEIFYPKLPKNSQKTFSEIADAFVKEAGYQSCICKTEIAAKEKAAIWQEKDKNYPVYYFASDTSGEKEEEEFFTAVEKINENTFQALGFISPQTFPTFAEIQSKLAQIKVLFLHENVEKTDIIAAFKAILPYFGHIETGKNLDEKM